MLNIIAIADDDVSIGDIEPNEDICWSVDSRSSNARVVGML